MISKEEALARGYHDCYFPDNMKCELCLHRFDCMYIRFDIKKEVEKE